MSLTEILGLIAGAITTGSFIPQVIRVFKIKSARDISLSFILAFVVGDSLWLAYGIYINQLPIIFWNVLAIIFALVLLFGKLKYSRSFNGNGFSKLQADTRNRQEKRQQV